VNDLLAPASMKLPVHESRDAGVYVCGLREDIVTSAPAVLALLEAGEAARHVGATRMNEKSSRSHTIFRMARGAPDAQRGPANCSSPVLAQSVAAQECIGQVHLQPSHLRGTTCALKCYPVLMQLGPAPSSLAGCGEPRS
jgi:hypothetical protein